MKKFIPLLLKHWNVADGQDWEHQFLKNVDSPQKADFFQKKRINKVGEKEK